MTDVEETTKKKAPWRLFGAIILVMFVAGLALGACSLGMKLPVAIFEYYVPPKVAP